MSHAIVRSFDDRARNLQQQLVKAESVFDELCDFTNLGTIPKAMQEKYGTALKPWTEGGELEFFSPERGQPIFFQLIAQLTSRGIDRKDLTQWRNPNALTVASQVNEVPEADANLPQPEGKMGKLATALKHGISSIGETLAGPDPSLLDGPQEPVTQDDYLHLATIYNVGCIRAKEYRMAVAPNKLREVRMAISMYVSVLMRRLRTYINEQISETGRQLTTVASA